MAILTDDLLRNSETSSGLFSHPAARAHTADRQYPFIIGNDGQVVSTKGAQFKGLPSKYSYIYNPDSPLCELMIAVSALRRDIIGTDFKTHQDTQACTLDGATHHAYCISEYFKKSNSSLCASWQTVSDFNGKIMNRLDSLMGQFVEQLKIFVETTQNHEQEIQKATDNANNLASDILKEIGL